VDATHHEATMVAAIAGHCSESRKVSMAATGKLAACAPVERLS
jgi:hypothetical protein